MTTTLSGNLGDLVGSDLEYPNGTAARAFLSPVLGYAIDGSEVLVGGLEITLATDGTFSATGLPSGSYQVLVTYYDPQARESTQWSSGVLDLSSNLVLEA